MELTFYLRKELKNSKGLMPIRMHISVDGSLIKKSIKEIKVLPEHWLTDKQSIKPSKKTEKYNNHIAYNKILDELKDKVNKIESHALYNNIKLTKEYVLLKLDEKETIEVTNDFFETFDKYIEHCKVSNAASTASSYSVVKNFFKDFCNDTGELLILDEIDLNTFDKLQRYAFIERKTLNNYFAKLIRVLKRFMNWSLERGYHKNLKFKLFSAPEQDIDVMYLTLDELFLLLNHTFEDSTLDRVRDTFCFACFTGLRISDLKNLKTSNIFNDHLKVTVGKTQKVDLTIPLNKYSQQILSKYKSTIYEPIPLLSEQKINLHIKTCCKEAKIVKSTTITRYIGSEKIETTLPKYKFISSHAGRKTFCTNSLVLGMSPKVAMSITGHKKDSSFNKYVNIADDQKKKQMEDTWDKL